MKTDTRRKEELIEEIFKNFNYTYTHIDANQLREIIDKYLVKHDEDVMNKGHDDPANYPSAASRALRISSLY